MTTCCFCFINPTTSKRDLNQRSTTMLMDRKICPAHSWSFIAQFLMVYTKTEQIRCRYSIIVLDRKNPLLSAITSSLLYGVLALASRFILPQDWMYPTLPSFHQGASFVCWRYQQVC